MLELVFLACLASAPDTCKQHVLRYADMPAQVCALHGQFELAAWANRNPGWDIREWSCQPAEVQVAEDT